MLNVNIAIDKATEKLVNNSVLKKELPFKNNFIDIAGHFMHYLDEGKEKSPGECILLVHGNPTWSFFYRNVVKELSKTNRVIAPDLIGLGLSERVDNKAFRAADRIDQLEEFINKLNIKSYSLVMHDWGGSIGSALALRDLSKVNRIVYLNTTLTETEAPPAFIKTAAMPIIGKYVTKTSNRFLKFLTTLGASKKVPKDIKKCFFLPYKSRIRRKAIWDFVADIPFDESHPSYGDMLSLAEGLPELAKKPVKIVWGLKDPCFHREMLSKVAEHFPDAEVHELPNASHLLLEDARDEAIQSISDFFKKSDEEILAKENQKLVNLEDAQGFYPYIKKYAQANPNDKAVIFPNFIGDRLAFQQSSYRDLLTLINKYQRGLQDLSLVKGDKVVMLVSPGIDFLALSNAIMARGAIPCFLDPGMGKEKLLESIKNLEPQAFIGSPKAQALRILYPKYFKNLKFNLVASDWIPFFTKTLNFLKKYSAKPLPEVRASQIAMLAFTSGATGSPKAVVFTNEMIKSQLEIFKNTFGLKAKEKDMPLLPIFSLFNSAIGVCSVIPPINPSKPAKLNPQKIVKLIKEQRISYSFGSPVLWRKIGEYCLRTRTKLDSLVKIHIAGAQVEESLFQILSEVSDAEVSSPYGATEALPVTHATHEELVGVNVVKSTSGETGVCVGKAIDSVTVKIIKPVDGVISDISEVEECGAQEIGETIVKGDNVSPAYYFNEEDYLQNPKNLEAKIKDGDAFWHRIGDMAYLDNDKNIYFCGRKVHRVIFEEKVFYSVPIERVFNQCKKVYRSALIADKAGKPALVVEPDPKYFPDTEEKKEGFVRELREVALQDEVTKGIQSFYFHDSFPVDGRHNAKIYRDRLRELVL